MALVTERKPFQRREIEAGDLFATANSYFGLLRQAPHSHHDRARLAKVALMRGRSVNRQLTQVL